MCFFLKSIQWSRTNFKIPMVIVYMRDILFLSWISVRPSVPNCVRSISLRRLEGFSWNLCQMFTSSWRCAEPMSWPYRFKIKVKLGRSKVWAFLSCLLHDISKTAWRYGADTIWDRQTDGRTYGRTDIQDKNNISPLYTITFSILKLVRDHWIDFIKKREILPQM